MIEIVCEVVVKPEASGLFALAYGPGGAWSDLFTRAAGFRGITVLRDAPQGFWVSGLPTVADVIVVGQEYVTDGIAVRVTRREQE